MSVDKLDLASPDLVNENFEKLAALFPNCVTEGAEGKAIDFDLLKQELSHAVVEGNKERYRLEWPGKREAIVTANLPTTKTLRPIREDSVDFDNTENLYIEGDNLDVLKLLQESYLGKIKMIYIDPPYNTGRDFVYKDNFSKQSEKELFESGQKDKYNQRLVANPETAGRYHSDWLSMMYPRLKLARYLLTKDGVIYISIDENELKNLSKLSEEIFGASNFVVNLIWKKRNTPPNDQIIGTQHDYIVCFAKDNTAVKLYTKPRTEEQLKTFKNPDNHPKGRWTSGDLSANVKGGRYSKALDFAIINPNNGKAFKSSSGNWRFNKEKIETLIKKDEIYFGQDGNGAPKLKRFLCDVKDGVTWSSIWDFVPFNTSGSTEMKELFGISNIFENPKPSGLLIEILRSGSINGDIILDFFSGSSSSAHALMQLNTEDGSNRKYIQVQIPEATDEKSEAFKAGYKNICEIGKERIRRAGKKIKEDTGADIDYGFRVYRLDSTNMQDVYYKPQDYDQSNLDLFADNVKSDRTADDLLAQVMLDWGLPLSLKIESALVADKQVFKVAENSLYACFDRGIDEAFAKAIAVEKPLRIVFKDSAFKNDTAKTNVKQLLKQLSPETEMKVI
jgi:adenine-specific DNA-methyltransferase